MNVLETADLAVVFFAASAAQASFVQLDLSPYVNQGCNSNGWYISPGSAPPTGSSFGNQGSTVPFTIANTSDGNNFWFGLDDGAGGLFGPKGLFGIAVTTPSVRKVYTLAANTFDGFEVPGDAKCALYMLDGIGSHNFYYFSGHNTRDYNYFGPVVAGATIWQDNGIGQSYLLTEWDVPAGFNLNGLIFDQLSPGDGAILLGVTLGVVPEPATWAMLIAGFGLVGVAARRRRAVVA